MGNISTAGRKRTFKWRIEGFSSLLELEATPYSSRSFKIGGYNWILRVRPKNIDKKTGKGCVGLYLELKDASSLPPFFVVNIVFKLGICEWLRNSHRTYQAECCYRNKVPSWGFDNVIDHDSLNLRGSGFLVRDKCEFNVEFIKIHDQKVDSNAMSECLSITKGPQSHSYTWIIEDFSELPRPEASSGIFSAGGHNWNLKLYLDDKKKHYLGLFLELVTTSELPCKSELYVEFSLRQLDQVNGDHKRFTEKKRFDQKSSTFGYEEFLPIDDFQDPSRGFVMKNGCVIEATIIILGSSTKP